MLNSFLKRIRSKAIYSEALIVPFIEANLSWIGADGLANEMNKTKYAPLICDSADPTGKDRVGVWTGESEKRIYAEELKRVLNNETIHFAEESQFIRCFSVQREENRIGVDPAKQKAMLIRQMNQFRKETRLPKDAFSVGKEVYTGKQPGQPDDLILATQICLYNSLRLRNSDKFLEFCQKRGFKA